jgi:hypothetical protein
MKNKAHFINELCKLKNWDSSSDNAKELENMKIVDLLIAIKVATPVKKEEVTETAEDEAAAESEAEEDESFSRRAGCRY